MHFDRESKKFTNYNEQRDNLTLNFTVFIHTQTEDSQHLSRVVSSVHYFMVF